MHRRSQSLKILVFEYLCGGGMAGQELSASLLAEGGMMLQALVNELSPLPQVLMRIPLEPRCRRISLPANAETIPIGESMDVMQSLPALMMDCDAVWPIAPETGGVLQRIAELAIAANKRLILSAPETIALCADKLATYRALQGRRIPCVPSELLSTLAKPILPCVIKPIDGAGCQGNIIVRTAEEFDLALKCTENPAGFIAQPLLEGRAVSVSALFNQGRAEYLCCNRQRVRIENQGFELTGCQVNVQSPYRNFYRDLLDRIAATLPELHGYIGVDLIETGQHGPLLLEINPRLTTSYVGIHPATGINVAEAVLGLRPSGHLQKPQGNRETRYNRTINVRIVKHPA